MIVDNMAEIAALSAILNDTKPNKYHIPIKDVQRVVLVSRYRELVKQLISEYPCNEKETLPKVELNPNVINTSNDEQIYYTDL